MRQHSLAPLALLALAGAPAVPADWPQWRGPQLRGTSPETKLPVKWSTSEGLAWTLDLPSASGSTPIVSGDRVYLNVAEGDTVSLWCLERKTGAPAGSGRSDPPPATRTRSTTCRRRPPSPTARAST